MRSPPIAATATAGLPLIHAVHTIVGCSLGSRRQHVNGIMQLTVFGAPFRPHAALPRARLLFPSHCQCLYPMYAVSIELLLIVRVGSTVLPLQPQQTVLRWWWERQLLWKWWCATHWKELSLGVFFRRRQLRWHHCALGLTWCWDQIVRSVHSILLRHALRPTTVAASSGGPSMPIPVLRMASPCGYPGVCRFEPTIL